jgi:hypothetical protein
MSQEEYVTRLRELNDDIAHAWLNNERVAALRLAVKVRLVSKDVEIWFFLIELSALSNQVGLMTSVNQLG